MRESDYKREGITMKVDRAGLSRHLSKLACGGQIEGAVFHGGLASSALSPDQLLLVIAPALEGSEELGNTLGIPWLPSFSEAIRLFSGFEDEEEGDGGAQKTDGADQVELRVEGHHLVVDEGKLGTLRILVAAPRTVGTFIEGEDVEALTAKTPKGKGITLGPQLISRIQDTFRWSRATEIELHIGPKGGKIRVGNENSNMAEFKTPVLKAKSEYVLLFGRHLVDVLGVTTGPSVVMKLGGPESLIVVEDEGYQFFLAPRSKGADA